MSVVVEHTPLVDLEARAGASDKDRELWLAERLAGVTATEVRDLMVKGASFKRELIDLKLGRRKDTFTGNQYTAWGKKREPIIAAWVASRFAIAEETRVFHAADDSRLLASPDGVGVAFDGTLLVDEIKTGKHDISPGSAHYKAVGYLFQKTWAMRVTGARRCLYAWEWHDDVWLDVGGDYLEPTPLFDEPQFAWIEYDEKLAAQLEKVALEFLAELDAARAAMDAGEGPVIDDELDTLAFNVLKFREAEARAKKAKEDVWKELQTACKAVGKSFSQESLLARVTYTPEASTTADGTAPDPDAAQAADAELWESLELLREQWAEHEKKFTKPVTVTTTTKASLTVTAPKIKEMK